MLRKSPELMQELVDFAYVEGEGNTLKRLLYKEDGPVLHPENKKMKDIPAKDCRIQGVALWVFKKVC